MATLGGNLSLPHSKASVDAKYHLQDTGTVGSEKKKFRTENVIVTHRRQAEDNNRYHGIL